MQKNRILMAFLLAFAMYCKRQPAAAPAPVLPTVKTDTVPRELQGAYCNEKKECHLLFISENMVADERRGGCPKVKQVLHTGDSYEIVCAPDPKGGNVSVKALGGEKFSITIAGQTQSYTRRMDY